MRAEWDNGKVFLLSPDTISQGQLIFWLASLLRWVAEFKDRGVVLAYKAQVRLPAVRQRTTPDVLFVSRRRMVKEEFIDGPPDLIMEIVSPDSQSRDWRDKYDAYEKSGVREYWVIDRQSQRVEAYALGRDGKFGLIEEVEGRIQSKAMRGLFIRPEWLWQTPLPKTATVLKELGVRG